MNSCANCTYWTATDRERTYRAKCIKHEMYIEFSFCCKDFDPVRVTVKTGENLLGYHPATKSATNGLTAEDLKDLGREPYTGYRDYSNDRGDGI